MIAPGHFVAGSALSFRKKAFFAVLVTTGFLVLLECLLAVFGVQPTLVDRDPYLGFESSIPLFVEASRAGEPVLETASNKLAYFNFQQFSKTKSPNTIRVFCLGGSTTFGRPFDDRTSFVGWLRELLPLADHEKDWEVINAGGVSYASYRVAAVMDELVKYSPDLFVIYTGHNEFLEARTYPDWSNTAPPLQRWAGLLAHGRLPSIARRLFTNEGRPTVPRFELPGEVDAILDHSVGPTSYARDDQLRSQTLEHFRFNLNRMVETAQSCGAKVIFVTPAANQKDFSPFKSDHTSGLDGEQRTKWSSMFAAAEESEANGDLDDALQSWKQAAAIDSGRADLHYRMAKTLFAQGRFDEAEAACQRAIDEDICPLRAPRAVQRLVEQVAVDRRAALVDFDSIVRGACLETYGHRVPGNEYFVDHVHPTVAGHRLLALAIVEAMSRDGWVAYGGQWGGEAIALATERVQSRIDRELQARALTNLAQVLSWAGKQQEAGPIAEQAVRLRADANLDDDPESMFYAAVSYAVKGRDDEAIGLLERVVELEPDNAQAQWRLASLQYDQLRFDDALVHFRQAVRLDPQDAYSFQMLGAVLTKLERYDDALVVLVQAAALAPDNSVIRDRIEAVRKRIAGG